MVNKTIIETRGRKNQESIAAGLDAAAKKKAAVPGVTDPTGAGPWKGGNPTTTSNADPTKKGKGKDGGKGKDSKGKGGKGKDNPKPTDNAAGTDAKPLDPNRSCITNLFCKCKLGPVLDKGVKCPHGIHRKKPTEADKAHHFFKRMEKQHGPWEPGKFSYADKPAAPAQQRGNNAAANVEPRLKHAGHTPPTSPVNAAGSGSGGGTPH